MAWLTAPTTAPLRRFRPFRANGVAMHAVAACAAHEHGRFAHLERRQRAVVAGGDEMPMAVGGVQRNALIAQNAESTELVRAREAEDAALVAGARRQRVAGALRGAHLRHLLIDAFNGVVRHALLELQRRDRVVSRKARPMLDTIQE